MQSMVQLLKAIPAVKLVTRADGGGNVEDSAGEGDAEVLGAVAAICNSRLESISELMGAGPIHSWTVVTENMSMFVQAVPEGFVAALGGAAKSPETVLKLLARQVEDK
jgi:predicted regulator of Ras-like GTPase activity (Roadblock/LC7/MglB family)